jgi:hypothetical protein
MDTRVTIKNIKALMFKFFKKKELNKNDFLNDLAKEICTALKKDKSVKCIQRVIKEYECDNGSEDDEDSDDEDSDDEDSDEDEDSDDDSDDDDEDSDDEDSDDEDS